MLTDTSIKFLNSSNLNGPLLNTDWGAFIRLLDACLVDGINNLNISSLSIAGSTPETSDLVTLTYLAPHGYQQYQVILLSGSQVESLNKEHRIQSVSSDGLSLTFKINSNVTDAGNTLNIMTKLAPLGWKKVFTEPFKAVYQMNSDEGPNHYFFVWNDNPNNIGYNYNIVVTPVGNPLFTSIDNVKCMKVETNKYLNISSTNNLNLGDSSDFYLEIDFYKVSNTYGILLSDSAGWTDGTTFLAAESGRVTLDVRVPVNSSVNSVVSSNTFEFNTWNKLRVFRKGTTLSIDLNGILTVKENFTSNIQFARNGGQTCVGTYAGDTSNTFNGYLSNFKLFIGRSTRPEKYDEKKVLHLDFSPTNKSYLFKDNFNKCIVHPTNISQRDYQNSSYCVALNGSTQYLTLGKTPLLNFYTDEFVIHIKFSVNSFDNVHQRLIADNEYSSGAFNYMMITGTNYSMVQNQRCIFFGIEDSSSSYMFSTTKVELNSIYDVKIIRTGNVFSMYVNDVLENTFTSSKVCNFNLTDNTCIGSGSPSNSNSTVINNQRFNGTLYSIKILRNTSDMSLLDSSNIIPETAPIAEIDLKINNNTLIDNGSSKINWISESAVLNSDYFTGVYKASPNNNLLQSFYKNSFVLDIICDVNRLSNIINQWSGNLRYQIQISTTELIFSYYYTYSGGYTIDTITCPITVSNFTRVTLLVNNSRAIKIYVNGNEISIGNIMLKDSFFNDVNEEVRLGDPNLKIKQFRLYNSQSNYINPI